MVVILDVLYILPTQFKVFILVLEKSQKKGAFPNENALLKLLYLRTQELQTKWNGGTIRNWSTVLNQLMINDKFKDRIEKYQRF